MEDGSFYDPFGFYFGTDGLDEAGGKYDDEGYYVSPFDVDIDARDIYDSEDDDDYPEETPSDALERQAIIEEHVVMASAWARDRLKLNPEVPLILKIEGIPCDTTIRNEDDVIKKLLQKRIPNFKHNKICLSFHSNKPIMTAYVQTADVTSVIKILGLHLQRCQLSVLKTWVMGFPDYFEMSEQDPQLQLKEIALISHNFKQMQITKKQQQQDDDEYIIQEKPKKNVKQVTAHDSDEFEINYKR